MQGIDDIPWHLLHHAYGTAEDVPDLICQLQSADPNADNEDSPLWHLYGNIWHQGTVYEATSYAVPFLIQLVEEPGTPDCVGILGLLAAIAQGSSYLDVHESLLRQYPAGSLGAPGTDEFERKKSKELEWVDAAHSAVAEGFDLYTRLLTSTSDVGYAAANVLACLSTRREETSQNLHRMLEGESRPRYRAGLILLMGELGQETPDVFGVINRAAASELPEERRAAAITASRLKSGEISDDLRNALVEAICDDDLDRHFEGLPWDVSDCIDRSRLLECDASASRLATRRLLALAESGDAGEDSYYTLCQLLFDHSDTVKAEALSNEQRRVFGAMVSAMEDQGRAFHLSLVGFGLPDSRRQLRSLAEGKSIDLTVDESLPVIGHPSERAKPLVLRTLKSGDRIHSRYFGLGTVHSVERGPYDFTLVVDFDEEGRKTLGLMNSPFRYFAELARYWLRRLNRRE